MWYDGVFDGFKWCAKIHDKGSKFGINSGRVGRLEVIDQYGNRIINYDRGWDIVPNTDEDR